MCERICFLLDHSEIAKLNKTLCLVTSPVVYIDLKPYSVLREQHSLQVNVVISVTKKHRIHIVAEGLHTRAPSDATCCPSELTTIKRIYHHSVFHSKIANATSVPSRHMILVEPRGT